MPTVQILLGGVDVTANVLFATARFQSKVNGQPGQGYMRVRDDTSTFSVTTGADWLVLVDGGAVWRGFAMQSRRVYIALAMDVSTTGLQRFVDVAGPDLNILFDRRVVFDKASPATVEGTQFAAGALDTTAIADLVANWLDLSADSIDTASGVTSVGVLDPAQKSRAWSGGWKWGDAMNAVNMIPNAVYYLRPESGTPHATLVWCDVDTPTSPFGLSDQPNGTTTKGYRECEITLDGTGLVTDDLAWGTGYGSQSPVFARTTDAAALATHGRWQDGQQVAGVYKAATITAIGNSVVYGSATNHRGAKDDRTSVELTTYEPGLLAGHVVAFSSAVWGFSDTIPVRQSDLAFDAPDAPRWRLVLSHAIDAPYGFYDQFWPKIPSYPLPCLTPPCIGGTGTPVLPVAGCPSFPGYVDDFDRVVAGSLGDSLIGPWTYPFTPSNLMSVDGSEAVLGVSLYYPDSGATSYAVTTGATPFAPGSRAWTMTWRIQFNGIDTNSTRGFCYLRFGFPDIGQTITIYPNNTTTQPTFCLDGSGTDQVYHSWALNHAYDVVLDYDGVSLLTCTLVDVATGTTLLTTSLDWGTALPNLSSTEIDWSTYNAMGPSFSFKVDFIRIDYAGDSTYWDSFDRTVASGWGTSDSGYAWSATTTVTSGSASLSVDGANGVITVDGTAGGRATSGIAASNPWGAGTWSMDALVTFTGDISQSQFTLYIRNGGTTKLGARLWLSSGNFTDPTVSVTTPFAFTTGVAYRVRQSVTWDALGTSSWQAKVWAEGTAEPGWMLSSSYAAVPAAGDEALVAMTSFGATTGPASASVGYIDFAYTGRPCYWTGGSPVVAGAAGFPAGPSGWGCEVPTRSSSTVYTTSAAFTAGSLLAWRNGVLQRSGTDYAEGADLASITFTDAVASTEEVTVCYLAQVSG